MACLRLVQLLCFSCRRQFIEGSRRGGAMPCSGIEIGENSHGIDAEPILG
jgi:hypothetical protein